MEASEGRIIGIDLGTTFSLVAIVEGSEPFIIPNTEGSNKTPSVVAFMEKGEVIVGEIARRQAATNPQRTITSIKRLMGRTYSDISERDERFAFEITEKDDLLLVNINGMGYKPEQISALILQKLKEAAEAYLQEKIHQAIITVPAYFDDLQRTATMEAARLAGLRVLRLVNEPTAAAMAYGLGKENEEIVAVYDFGGGTFDVSILEIDHNAFEVLVSNGDTHLGGDDLDNALVSWIVKEFQEQNGVNLSDDPMTLFRLKEAAEKAKCDLSTTTQSIISLPFIGYQNKKPLHLEKIITRDMLEDLIRDYVLKTMKYCRMALQETGLSKNDISKVILVGGSSRIPLVQEEVENFFGIQPFKGVNPDEIVALGAATQAGILSGRLQEVVLLDITPHSLGVEVKEGKVSKIIEKNSTIPIKAAKTFTTTEDNQTFVNIHIVQGESEEVSENQSLGKFTLSDIQPSTAGVPRIRITFFINADGVLDISANDMASGKERSLTITHSFLTGEEKKKTKRRKSIPAAPPAQKALPKAEDAEQILAGVHLESPIVIDQELFDINSLSSTFKIVKDGTQVQISAEYNRIEALPSAPAGKKENGVHEASTLILHEGAVSQGSPTFFDPEIYNKTLEMLQKERRDEEAQKIYALFGETAIELEKQKIPLPSLISLLMAKIHIMRQSPEESFKSIHTYRLRPDADPEMALETYHLLLKYYPDMKTAIKELILIYQMLKKVKEALGYLEKLQEEDMDEQFIERLEEIYTEYLKSESDPVIEFKLVKIYLKKNKLDEAIALLLRLIQHDTYKFRALKILGLTYWQKKMYAQAWQTFNLLPPNPDLLDILFRLAGDLEKAGDLFNAREIYKRILSESPNFKSAETKFKKIKYRIELQMEEFEKQKPPTTLQDPRFTILEEVNRGSMGVIFKAKDEVVGDIVAVKVLNDYLCEDPKAVERFKTEARAAKKLSHPYIVRIHDMFESGRKLFLSMEFIAGTDLKKMLASKFKFTEEIIVRYFLQIADALSYAHKMGIVHRDIKPANIMITPDDTIKITDFGIAKILRGDSITRTGTAIIGTPLYMSPEQIIGGDVDARSDIYSLGILLYEMVHSNPPFFDGNIEYHHVNTEPVPPTGDVSEKLISMIMKMIQKKPKDRFQSIDEIFPYIKSR
jgi:molecular chaperone DnaK